MLDDELDDDVLDNNELDNEEAEEVVLDDCVVKVVEGCSGRRQSLEGADGGNLGSRLS